MENVILEYNLDNLMLPERRNYREFIYCTEGCCDIETNGRTFTLKQYNCAILITRFFTAIRPSADFKCQVIYIDANFLRQSEPNHPYIIQATLMLSINPIIEPELEERELCRQLFYNFGLRINDQHHKFYDEMLRTSARMLLLDMFDMHSRTHKNDITSFSSADLMTRFIRMLQDKEYRDNREVAYYAKELYVVPKYLSEVCNKISGFSASYWINRFTAFEIGQLLHEKRMSSAEIAQMFHFTSTSYFNRYVKRYLGVYPSELRGQ